MQYLLTEEEFKNSIPASAIEPFTKALLSYYARKSTHLEECLRSARADYSGRSSPIMDAIDRHRQEWTEKPPEPKDFIKGLA